MIARRVYVLALAASLVAAGMAEATEVGLPRLAGVVVAPGAHVALFDAGGGTLLEVTVGDEIAGFRVLSVERDGVRVARGDERALLTTRPAATRPRPANPAGATFGLVLRPQPPLDD